MSLGLQKTGNESRLNRPMEGKFGSLDYAKEEMRAAIAGILIGGELKTGHNFGLQAAYMSNFMKILKDTPFELAKAARDAQKITGLLLGTGQKREQKTGTNTGFSKGYEIAYQENIFKVIDAYKNKSIKVEDASGTRKTVKSTDGLYASLLEAKNNPKQPEMVMGEEQGQSQQSTHKIGR